TILHGDIAMALCARDLRDRDLLHKNTVVATVMSNLGLELALRDAGIQLLRVQVGDRYIIEAMRQGGYSFGGEPSGHLIFSEYSTTGDGILAALQVMSILIRREAKLSALSGCMEVFPQVLLNVRVRRKKALGEIPELQRLQESITGSLGEKGRLLL